LADQEENEILKAARDAKAREDAAKDDGGKAKRWPLGRIGLGVGIGSAAIAAAVLFTNRDKN
jgi:hypothetical protein